MDKFNFAPGWFQRELRAIDPRYFAAFNPACRGGRWQVREWKFWHKPGRTDWAEWPKRSLLVTSICHYIEKDGGVEDGGYMPLDGRALFAVKRGRHNAEDMKQVLYEMDKADEERQIKADAEMWDVTESKCRDIRRHYTVPRTGYGSVR